MFVWIVLIVALILLCFILFTHLVGNKFLSNLKRKNPGEKFTAGFDVSFYMNGPLHKIAQDGMKYMETLPHEDIYINSYDGLKLHATLFPAEKECGKYVLGIHGFQSHAWNEYAPYIAYYRSLGYGMLLPNDRAHDYSEGDYITMGVKDRFDCLSWTEYLIGRFGKEVRILYHGVSMGAATVLAASGEKDLPPQVIGVISDCGFSCVRDAFAAQMKSLFHVNSPFIVDICQWFARHKAGFDFNEARPVDQVKKTPVPVLFVQGEDDMIVPEYMATELYEACNAPHKRLLMVPHANHAESIAVDPEGYHKAIEELLTYSEENR